MTTSPAQGEHAQTEALDDLYLKLHGMSKRLESSGRIDESDAPEAYPAILDAMNLVRRLQSEAGQVPAPTSQPAPATQQAGEIARSNCMDCANTDSWGLPDKVFCRTCVSGSHWEPLNRDSVNPNKAAPQPSPTAQAAPAAGITVEQVEDAIGLQSTAWDTIGAEKIVEAVLRLANAKAPAAGAVAGEVVPLDVALHAVEYLGMHNSASRETEMVQMLRKAAAPTPAAQADSVLEDAVLSPAEADLLEKAISDFEECGETDVPDAALRRFAAAGYLECVHYHVMPTAQDAIDAAHKQGGKHD